SLDNKDSSELLGIFNCMPQSQSFSADTSTHKRLIRAIEIAKWLETNQLREEPNSPPRSITFGIEPDLNKRRESISERLRARFEQGLIKEVEQLLAKEISAEMLIFYGLEYKIITQHLQGEYNLEECFKRLEIAIHQFAKRQMTYFRKMEKDGLKINWMKEGSLEERLAFIKKYL